MTLGNLAEPRAACSVVIGARLAEHDIDRCLRALEPQVGPDVEVIVVHDGSRAAWPPWVRHHERPGGLVPELWAVGLAEATGTAVAVISGGVVPERGWLARARVLAQGTEAAVGGAIEPGPRLGMVDWAVYFCRYAAYMLPFPEGPGIEVPADNAVYRAEVLAEYRHLWAQAFWEPFVHQAMRADGHLLALSPDLVVRTAPGTRLATFARQRFLHGRTHGQLRSAGSSRRAIVVASTTAPLVPAVMAGRAARQIWAKRRYRPQLVVSLPLMFWLYFCWAAGELAGRMRAVRQGPVDHGSAVNATRP